MKFPTIKQISAALRSLNSEPMEDQGEEGLDVRLQVYESGDWAIRFGDSGYDLDHHGFWGASSVPGNGRRFNSRNTAKDLIEQCRESEVMSRE